MSTAIELAGALHEAVLYSAPDELAERLVPRLLPSLDDGAPVVAVLDETTRAEFRRALGDAAEQVAFPDPAVVHRVPPFTVAARWARLSRHVTTPTGRATVIGQHVEGLPGCDDNHWARLDIALQRRRRRATDHRALPVPDRRPGTSRGWRRPIPGS